MKRAILASVVMLALHLAACGRAKPLEATSTAAENVDSAAPASTSVSGQNITFLGGRARLRMPEGWAVRPNAKQLIEIEALRYKNDLERWAICHLTVSGAPNLTLATQEAANARMPEAAGTNTKALTELGLQSNISFLSLDDGLRIETVSYTDGGADVSRNHIMIVDRLVMHLILVVCDVASPATEQDRSDISDFLKSFHFERS